MKLNFSTPILDLEGKPCKVGEKETTLGTVVIEALMAVFPDEQNLLGETKLKRFRLAEVAIKGGEQDLSVDDVSMIKALVGKAYGPLVVGRVYDMLDPPPKGD